jgi:hypothetical protein
VLRVFGLGRWREEYMDSIYGPTYTCGVGVSKG